MPNLFDREAYPELAVCGAMPEIVEGIINIEITDWNTNKLLFDVPTASVTRVGMPKLRPEYSGNPDSPFEKGIGLGLVVCRILNTHKDLYSIEIPTVFEPATIVIPLTSIARPRLRKAQ